VDSAAITPDPLLDGTTKEQPYLPSYYGNSMPHIEHDAIELPPDNTTIFRYLSTSQFLDLLRSNSIHFTRLDELSDPFEGYGPIKNIKKEMQNAQNHQEELESLDIDESKLGDPAQRTQSRYEHTRSLSLVNCWSITHEDKLPMWKSYLQDGDGLAIKTTFGDLKESINSHSNTGYHAGVVDYDRYFDKYLDYTNYFELVMSKPKQYEFENELRLFIWWPTSGEVDLESQVFKPGDSLDPRNLRAPPDLKISIDADTLINEIYVSPFGPPWLNQDYFDDILGRYNIEATTSKSNLATDPREVFRNQS
jgi:hypothetical protein